MGGEQAGLLGVQTRSGQVWEFRQCPDWRVRFWDLGVGRGGSDPNYFTDRSHKSHRPSALPKH